MHPRDRSPKRTYSLREKIRENGYAFAPSVISAENCAYYVDSMWKWFESFGTEFRRDDPITWKAKNLPTVSFKRATLDTLSFSGKLAWNLRSLKHSQLYGVASQRSLSLVSTVEISGYPLTGIRIGYIWTKRWRDPTCVTIKDVSHWSLLMEDSNSITTRTKNTPNS